MELLAAWASARRVSAAERDRWLRAGWLHDALRDAPAADELAHGPLAAERAAADGERDRGVLEARHGAVADAERIGDDAGREVKARMPAGMLTA